SAGAGQKKKGPSPADWLSTGNDLVGKGIRRFGPPASRCGDTPGAGASAEERDEAFDHYVLLAGTVMGWVPAANNDGVALWRVVYEDGGEEHIQEGAARAGVSMFHGDGVLTRYAEEQRNGDFGAEPLGGGAAAANGETAAANGGGDNARNADGGSGDSNCGGGEVSTRFLSYENSASSGTPITDADLGLHALRVQLLMHEATMMLSGIGEASRREYGRASGGGVAPRTQWLRLVREALSLSELRAALLELEENVHSLQAGEDVIEDGRMSMEVKGWRFGNDAHEAIGRRVRRFFLIADGDSSGAGGSDGGVGGGGGGGGSSKETALEASDAVVVAHLPTRGGKPARFHIVYEDGEEEEIGGADLQRGLAYAEREASEPDEDDDNEDVDDDASHGGGGGKAGGKSGGGKGKSKAGGKSAAAAATADRAGDEDNDEDGEGDGDGQEEQATAAAMEVDADATDDEEEEDGDDDGDDDDDYYGEHGGEQQQQQRRPSVATPKTAAGGNSRATLWRSWGTRQRWIKGVQAAQASSLLSLALISLVENAVAMGVSSDSLLEANRAKGRRAAAVAARAAGGDGWGRKGKR
ncbi:unnamed protein product, partial [Phaeothamnion confervicola]